MVEWTPLFELFPKDNVLRKLIIVLQPTNVDTLLRWLALSLAAGFKDHIHLERVTFFIPRLVADTTLLCEAWKEVDDLLIKPAGIHSVTIDMIRGEIDSEWRMDYNAERCRGGFCSAMTCDDHFPARREDIESVFPRLQGTGRLVLKRDGVVL